MLPKKFFFLLAAFLILGSTALVYVFVSTKENATAQNGTPVATESLDGEAPPFFDGERAFANVEMVMQYGAHITGSPEIKMVGDDIIARLEAAGWEVITQEFNVIAGEMITLGRNIIAKRGEGPITLLGSHYDSRMVADADPDPNRHTDPVPGANDGGSSTGVLLEFADLIDEHYALNEQIWLVFFDAEDNGRIQGWDWILGSRFMADNLEMLGITPQDIELMILFDLVGEKDLDDYTTDDPAAENAGQQEFPQEGYSVNNALAQTEAIWAVAAELGYAEVFQSRQRGPITDDHLPFIQRGIPAVDIIDLDYPFWHTVEDTIDKLSPQSLERAGEVVEIYLIQTDTIRVKTNDQ